MPQYKLTYFPLRGRGDMIRYIFHYANIPFEEQNISFEDWPNKKPTFKFNQLPVLEVDGKSMHQSVAIGRYLANKFNLAGKTEFDHQQCDAYVDGVQDLWSKLIPTIVARLLQKDEKAAKENFAKFKEETFKPFMERYEKFLEENNTGCLVGNQITWADLVLVEWLDRMDGCFDKGIYAGHKRLEALVKKVQDHAGIKKLLIQRPKTPG